MTRMGREHRRGRTETWDRKEVMLTYLRTIWIVATDMSSRNTYYSVCINVQRIAEEYKYAKDKHQI